MKKITPLIILFLTIILSISFLKKSDSFIYAFLSDAYFLHLFTLALLISLFLEFNFNDKIELKGISYQLVIFITWILYILIYCILSCKCELYFYTYLLVNFIIELSFVYLIRTNKLQSKILYIPIALLGISESLVAILQYIDVMSSNSSNFAVTGTMDNPNVASMIICLSIPSLIELTLNFKSVFRVFTLILCVLIIVSLLVLECRTALVGTIVVASIYALKIVPDNPMLKSIYSKIAFVIIFMTLISAFYILQDKKKASANGRLTIWKVTAEMIAKKPISGYGYGQFQREYNLKQADYFNLKSRSESERMNAGFTAMGYNEYIQHTVMGGLFGGLLFSAVIVSLLFAGWKNRDLNLAPFAGLFAYAIMSLFNFTVESPAIFFIFIFYAAVLLSQNSDKQSVRTFILPKKIVILCSLVAFIFVFISLRKYEAQKDLTTANRLIQTGHIKQAGEILHDIEPDISTSEVYFRTKAFYFILNRDYTNAQNSTKQALNYTSDPSILLSSAQLAEKIGNSPDAESCYRIACGIEPHQFRPRVKLMEMYLRERQIRKARYMANEILRMKPKFNLEKVRLYKKQALKVISNSKT